MADASRPVPRARRYTQAQPRTVQPPDDRTYSAEVTGSRRNLLHHRIARAVFPYTRSNILPRSSRFVNRNLRINYKNSESFSSVSEKNGPVHGSQTDAHSRRLYTPVGGGGFGSSGRPTPTSENRGPYGFAGGAFCLDGARRLLPRPARPLSQFWEVTT